MLHILDIEIQSLAGILDLLQTKKVNQSVSIEVPKRTVLFFSTKEDISEDYLLMSYVKKRFEQAAETVDFDFIGPEIQDSIIFVVQKPNWEKLAEAVFEVSFFFNNEDETIDDIFLNESLYSYRIGGNVGCPFFKIYEEFNQLD